MEIIHIPEYASKRLHIHTVPLLLAVFVASVLAVSGVAYYNAGGSDSVVTKGLTKQNIHVKPTANGLGRVTIGDETAPAAKSSAFTESGRVANTTFSFRE